MSHNDDIKKYLYKYAYNLKNYGINDSLRRAKQLYKNINKYVSSYIKKYPKNLCLLEGNSAEIYSGGALIDKDFTDKMTQIATIFNLYKGLNLSEIHRGAQTLEAQLDDVIREMNLLNPTDAMLATASEDKIINSLEHIRTNAEKFATGFKVNLNRSKLYVPPREIGDLPQTSYFDQILESLKMRILQIKTDIDNGILRTTSDMDAMVAEIDRHILHVRENIGKMDELDQLKLENTRITDSFKFVYDAHNISYVKTVHELIADLMMIGNEGDNPAIKQSIKIIYDD